MEIETTESSCHRCPVCTDQQHSKVSSGHSHSVAVPNDFCDDNSQGGSLPEGFGLVAASLLLFFVPAALSLAGAIAFGQTASMQWLGGIGGFGVGILGAVFISKRVWTTDDCET